jgi:ribonuclease HI
MAIKAIECSKINSKFVWYCHQSMVNLAEYKRIQLVWVPCHMWIVGNETVDQLVSQASHIHLTVSQPSLGISTKAARGDNRAR